MPGPAGGRSGLRAWLVRRPGTAEQAAVQGWRVVWEMVLSGSPSNCVQRSRLWARQASTVQAPLACSCWTGKCSDAWFFEVGDDLLDDGVVAMLGLDDGDRRCDW